MTTILRSHYNQGLKVVAIYAGVPRANHALKLAKATYAEMESST